MRAVVIYEPGGPEQLKLEERPIPRTKPGWSLVKVMGFGINHSEIYTRKGQSPSVHFPRVLGIECVGLVEETTDPMRLPKGQKVVSIMGEMGRAFDGSYEEYVLLPNRQIYPVETDLQWELLAAVPETYFTAYSSLKNLRLDGDPADDFSGGSERRSSKGSGMQKCEILVRGGTSGVGIAFTRLVKSEWGDRVHLTGTSRSLRKEAQMKEAGYDEVIADSDNRLQTEAKYDRILDLIGPAALRDTFAHMNEGGIVCVTGLLGNVWTLDNFDPLEDMAPNSYITSVETGIADEHRIGEMLDFIRKYKVDVRPAKVFRLDEIQEAHRYLEGMHSFGKVVVVI